MSIRLWGPDGFLGGRRVQTQTGTRRWGPAIPGALSSFWRARGRLAGFHRAPMVILGQNQRRISPDQLVVCVAMILPAMRPQRQVGSWIVISRKFDLGFWIWIIFSIRVFDRLSIASTWRNDRCGSSCPCQRNRWLCAHEAIDFIPTGHAAVFCRWRAASQPAPCSVQRRCAEERDGRRWRRANSNEQPDHPEKVSQPAASAGWWRRGASRATASPTRHGRLPQPVRVRDAGAAALPPRDEHAMAARGCCGVVTARRFGQMPARGPHAAAVARGRGVRFPLCHCKVTQRQPPAVAQPGCHRE